MGTGLALTGFSGGPCVRCRRPWSDVRRERPDHQFSVVDRVDDAVIADAESAPVRLRDKRGGVEAERVGLEFTALQRLPHDVLDRDTGCRIRHALVDDPVDLALFPFLVLAQDVDRNDRGHLLASPRDDRRRVITVGSLDLTRSGVTRSITFCDCRELPDLAVGVTYSLTWRIAEQQLSFVGEREGRIWSMSEHLCAPPESITHSD